MSATLAKVHVANVIKAAALADAACALAKALAETRGQYTRRVLEREADFYRAVGAYVDDGDCAAALENVLDELYPRRGHNSARFNESMVHPDDPCQSKGYVW